MAFDSVNLNKTGFVQGAWDYQDFEVTSENYDEEVVYECENGHTGAEPALLEDCSSYNPINGRFEIKGVVVYVCPTCCQPVIPKTIKIKIGVSIEWLLSLPNVLDYLSFEDEVTEQEARAYLQSLIDDGHDILPQKKG